MIAVLLQTLVLTLVSPILVVWALVFCIVSFFSRGNAVLNPKSIVITGASSGLGQGLAVGYSKPGVTLGLMGRSIERLEDVANLCKIKGAKVEILQVDTTQREGMREKLIDYNSKYPIDIVIANAGVSVGTCGEKDREDQYYAVFATNVIGVLNTVLPLFQHFKARKCGQIILMGSLGSQTGPLTDHHSYCASKAAIDQLAASWRSLFKPFGVGVSVISPGYVKTAMTARNTFNMPFAMDTDSATPVMINGISRDYAVIAYPTPLTCYTWLLNCIPVNLLTMVVSHPVKT